MRAASARESVELILTTGVLVPHTSTMKRNLSSALPAETTVLVTGGSGYVGTWTAAGLLERGYRVRATVRSLKREPAVRAAVERRTPAGERLTFVAADLLADDGWDRAVAGVDAVFHVASPMPIREYRKTDLVRPAREGTRRVLTAAAHAAVQRVVMMSSVQASLPAETGAADTLADESNWTDVARAGVAEYTKSKTLAERDAWQFVADHPALELTTVLAASIQGPVLQSAVSGSVEVVQRLLKGTLPAIPRLGFAIVDVRDLVELQVRAMCVPEAAGERFIAAGDFLWMREMATILRDEFGPAAARVPTRTLPSFVVRAFALVDPEARFIVPNLDRRQLFSAERAKRLLGARFRPVRESIVDSARSLIALGAV